MGCLLGILTRWMLHAVSDDALTRVVGKKKHPPLVDLPLTTRESAVQFVRRKDFFLSSDPILRSENNFREICKSDLTRNAELVCPVPWAEIF